VDHGRGGQAQDEVRTTAVLLLAVAELVQGPLDAASARAGVTGAQARVVLALAAPAPMGSLAEQLRCDASNVTGMADRLEARGLVARAPSPCDRRVKVLALTRAGQQLREELVAALAAGSPVREALDPEQRAQLVALLRAVVEAAGAARAPFAGQHHG
jgi:DNA-binding MarR family transcriptional regulator